MNLINLIEEHLIENGYKTKIKEWFSGYECVIINDNAKTTISCWVNRNYDKNIVTICHYPSTFDFYTSNYVEETKINIHEPNSLEKIINYIRNNCN